MGIVRIVDIRGITQALRQIPRVLTFVLEGTSVSGRLLRILVIREDSFIVISVTAAVTVRGSVGCVDVVIRNQRAHARAHCVELASAQVAIVYTWRGDGLFLSRADEEQKTSADYRGNEAEVVARFGVTLVDVSRHGDAYQDGYRLGTLHEAPGFGKVSGSDPLEREHLQGVAEASQADSVKPHEENVTVVALDRAQSKERYAWKII